MKLIKCSLLNINLNLLIWGQYLFTRSIWAIVWKWYLSEYWNSLSWKVLGFCFGSFWLQSTHSRASQRKSPLFRWIKFGNLNHSNHDYSEKCSRTDWMEGLKVTKIITITYICLENENIDTFENETFILAQINLSQKIFDSLIFWTMKSWNEIFP